MTQNSDSALAEAFPAADAGVQPFGSRVLVQIRSARQKSAGGIILTTDTKATESDNTQTAKVISTGALAFHSRNTQQPWPEGSWCVPGDFVRVPKYGGDRWAVALPEGGDAIFVLFNDLDLLGRVTGDPLQVKAFI